MKPLFTFLVLFAMQLGCSDNCSIEKANVFQDVTISDISNLQKINDLILKNIDTLIIADEINESDSLKGRKEKFHSISSGGLKQLLPKEDLLEFDKLTLTFNNTKNKFYFYNVDYRGSDSTFDYELRLEICDSTNQTIDITHHLLFRTNSKKYNIFENSDKVKEKKINNYWTYYIANAPNDPF